LEIPPGADLENPAEDAALMERIGAKRSPISGAYEESQKNHTKTFVALKYFLNYCEE